MCWKIHINNIFGLACPEYVGKLSNNDAKGVEPDRHQDQVLTEEDIAIHAKHERQRLRVNMREVREREEKDGKHLATDDLLFSKEGDVVTFGGEKFTIVQKNGRLVAENNELSNPKTNCLIKFFGTRYRRLQQLTEQVNENLIQANMLSAKQQHFRVDVDKNILYRGKLPEGVDPNDFIQTNIAHKKYSDNKEVKSNITVYINKRMLKFLITAQQKGAKVSITTTGRWNEESLRSALEGISFKRDGEEKGHALVIDEFDNKDSLNAKGGFNRKFKGLGKKDKDGRTNIMLDDQVHQLRNFTYSNRSDRFGMQRTWKARISHFW